MIRMTLRCQEIISFRCTIPISLYLNFLHLNYNCTPFDILSQSLKQIYTVIKKTYLKFRSAFWARVIDAIPVCPFSVRLLTNCRQCKGESIAITLKNGVHLCSPNATISSKKVLEVQMIMREAKDEAYVWFCLGVPSH